MRRESAFTLRCASGEAEDHNPVYLHGVNFKESRPRASSLGKARRMNGDQSFVRPALRLRTGSRTTMGELGKVRRAASNALHASRGALAPERQAPSFESGSALNSTHTSLRRPLPTRWRIRVAERTVREKRSSMRVWSLPGEITSTSEDKLVSCVVSCSKCSKRQRRGQT